MENEWKEHPELTGYLISSEGLIKRLARKRWNGQGYQDLPELVLTNVPNVKGYMVVTVQRKTRYVHRLVAQTFIKSEKYFGQDVNHKDGNKANNHISNLEWCDRKFNINHAFDTGLVKIKSEHHASRYTQKQVEEVIEKYSETKLGPKALQEKYFPTIPRTTISSFIHGHNRKGR